MTSPSVPFFRTRYGESYMSVTKTRGIVRCDDDAIVIEFRATTTRYDTFASEQAGVESLTVPLDAVEALEAKGGIFGARLVLRTRSLRALEPLPDADGNEYVLRIPWRERGRARELAVTVSLQLASRELRQLEEEGS